jgi:VanZ family protein
MQRLFQLTAWLLSAAIVVLSVSPPSARPVTPVGHNFGSNFEHLLIFLAAGGAFALGYPRRIWLLLFAMLGFAGAVEIAQMLVPGRHARLSDFLVDVFSLYCGIGISYAALRLLKHAHPERIP